MKRFLVLVLMFFVALAFLSAQSVLIRKDDKLLSLGVGIGSTLYASGTGYSTAVPPISISYEHAVAHRIFKKGVLGVGGYVGYSLFKSRFFADQVDFGWNYHNFIIGAGGVFHYPFIDNLDTYAGAMIGYNIASASEYGDPGSYTPVSTGGLVLSGYVGARYYFSQNVAGFVHLGYGVAYLTLGVSTRL